MWELYAPLNSKLLSLLGTITIISSFLFRGKVLELLVAIGSVITKSLIFRNLEPLGRKTRAKFKVALVWAWFFDIFVYFYRLKNKSFLIQITYKDGKKLPRDVH